MEEEEEQPPASTSQSQQSQEPQQSLSQSQDITIPQTGPGGREIAAAHEPTHPSHRETSLLSGGIGTPFPYTPYTPYTMETQQDTRVNVEDTSNIYDAGYDNWLTGSALTPYNNRSGRTPRPQRRIIRRDICMKILWSFNAVANLSIMIGCGFLVYYYIHSSIQSIYEIVAKYVIITYLVLEKEGYILFGRVRLTDDQITKLANAADSTCFIIMVLFTLHYWLVVKESNPIFTTESRSPDPLPPVQPPEADTTLTTATGGRRLGVRVENYETYYRMEGNNCCDNCYEWDYVQCDCGICDCNGIIAGCCGSVFNLLYVSFNKFWLLD
ncbi:2911_t:CDS:2 [Cetraspora pellucida]|uniref:2911_t:CDS:1 n=1 Tax=Cetraspora pellucida TaxID=1433469 RepID=A0ACA9JYH6_9GLOM|nr:2911_t:CDS:2 [Cetraspora pellucida]